MSIHSIHSALNKLSQEFILRCNQNPHMLSTDIIGHTPLFHAITFRSPAVVETYLQQRLYSVNATDILGDTPLVHALKHYDSSDPNTTYLIVHHLLKAGADPNLRRPGSPTPLMLAALHEDIFLVNALLLMGADGNIRIGEDGLFFKKNDTALSLAVAMNSFTRGPIYSMKQLQCIQILIQNSRVVLSPNVVFHAMQQTRHPFLRPLMKDYIMMLSK